MRQKGRAQPDDSRPSKDSVEQPGPAGPVSRSVFASVLKAIAQDKLQSFVDRVHACMLHENEETVLENTGDRFRSLVLEKADGLQKFLRMSGVMLLALKPHNLQVGGHKHDFCLPL